MPLLRRFRRTTLTRLLALCVLLLGVIAQPVMASVGGVHELGHGAALHSHVDTDAHADTPGDEHERGDDESGKTGGLLHALMHATHCCGHAPAMPVAATIWQPLAPPETVSFPHDAPVPTHRSDKLLRPPIAI
ncbi:hypothetical protein M8R20_37885 [Pseudomonas sp. R2.Fl]|nr:hypothetical protein [Pseudomonas sp. R2.Fl]